MVIIAYSYKTILLNSFCYVEVGPLILRGGITAKKSEKALVKSRSWSMVFVEVSSRYFSLMIFVLTEEFPFFAHRYPCLLVNVIFLESRLKCCCITTKYKHHHIIIRDWRSSPLHLFGVCKILKWKILVISWYNTYSSAKKQMQNFFLDVSENRPYKSLLTIIKNVNTLKVIMQNL